MLNGHQSASSANLAVSPSCVVVEVVAEIVVVLVDDGFVGIVDVFEVVVDVVIDVGCPIVVDVAEIVVVVEVAVEVIDNKRVPHVGNIYIYIYICILKLKTKTNECELLDVMGYTT